jgi:2-C-methyl-D-erythritol 4-phosphate cytidylyltransferase/2-C-methyl-D-erythritol 2,4-cyclodiphosphate synthase
MTDTIRQVSETASRVLDRTALRAIQTPQAFAFDRILVAHRDAAASGRVDFPDDSAVAEWAGLPIGFFEGDSDNVKITQPGDFAAAEARLLAGLPDVRIGQGYDVHAFGPGAGVWLGGVEIPHTHALLGHSDADVLMHAITDALLGALADGDIGSHFPPSDPRWKGASSDIFLRHAVDLLRQRGGMLANVDGTVICEAPKVGPHRDAIRARLAEICGLTLDRVAVKATTSEGLGFTGRREGIAAMATATIRLPLERSGS